MENHNSPAPPPILEVRGLTKSFFGIPVLENAHLSLHRGQVHGLMGENGAGKSTLMKVLAGVYQPDAGTVLLEGEEVTLQPPHQGPRSRAVLRVPGVQPSARPDGGREHLPGPGAAPRTAGEQGPDELENGGVARSAGDHRHPAHHAGAEPDGGRAAGRGDREGGQLSTPGSSPWTSPRPPWPAPRSNFSTGSWHASRERGTAILYVSHRLREVFDLCDVITVLKDGKVVSTRPASELDDARLVRLMVGRPISAFFPDKLPRENVDADGVRRGADPRVAGRRKRPAGRDKPPHPTRRDCRPGRAPRVRPHGIAARHLWRRTLHPRDDEDGRRGAAAQITAPGRAGADGPDHRGPQGRGPEPEPVHPGQRTQL